jgi:hypothetical protein
MRLVFSNLHFDGEIRSRSDVLLRVVGDFAVLIGERRLYQEVEFCLVEFAITLARWLAAATDDGPDFVYTSMESEIEGLVRFTRVAHGAWRISAAHEQYDEVRQLTTEQVKAAARTYIHGLRGALLPAIDIFDQIEDESALRAARSWN